jgi:acetyl/propionyl-CoA carboxylase alpha subunit
MLKTTVNGGTVREISFQKDLKSGSIDGKDFELDLLKIKEGTYHLVRNNKSYNIEVLECDPKAKTYELRVNGIKYAVALQDQFDTLLKNLGMQNLESAAVKTLKAPMPGLVLEVMVGPGSEVKKGDPLLVLEAMKMENVLKAPTDAVIKDVIVEISAAVEKNQVLVNFE